MAEIPIVILLKNNKSLNQACLRYVLKQDIPVFVWLLDNGSTDGTIPWALAESRNYPNMLFNTLPELAVAGAWNFALRWLFDSYKLDCAIILNNDTMLRPDTARYLYADGGGFVTAVGTCDVEKINPPYLPPDPAAKRPHPDFSCYLIRRWVWEKVGPFDEDFKIGFCEDADFHCRMHQAGIRAEALELPFFHYGSGTVKNADPGEKQRIMQQAEKNREHFRKKWGFAVGSPEYYRFFNSSPPPEEGSAARSEAEDH